MSNLLKSPKTAAIAATIIFIGLASFLAMEINVNDSLKNDLDAEKLKSEQILSEKLALEKNIQKFRAELKSLEGKNSGLDNIIKETTVKLDKKEQEIKNLNKQNSSLFKFKKQYEELALIRNQLDQQIADLNATIRTLRTDNEGLNKTIIALQLKNKDLLDENSSLRVASFNEGRIETVRGSKDKLTVSSKKTQKLNAIFNVPASTGELNFKIIDSNGKMLGTKEGGISSRVIENNTSGSYTAGVNSAITPNTAMKKIEMEYIPKEKLSPGIYTVEVLDKNLHIGSLQVRLK
jgi:predicted  nucleic acid-binding Zn-ribbon protein